MPVPFTRGYIHLGDSMIFIAAILFGWRVGALAGGLGSALADVVADTLLGNTNFYYQRNYGGFSRINFRHL